MRHLLTTILFLCLSLSLFSQGVSINPNGNPPAPSAGLDVDFTDKGVLLPRLTASQRDAIQSPAIGLVIYNLDCKNLNIFNGFGWDHFNSSAGSNAPGTAGSITGTSTICTGQSGISFSVGNILNASDYIWQYSGSGFSIASGDSTNSILADFSPSATSGSLTVYGVNSCGQGSPSAAYSITIGSAPAAPVAAAASGATNTEITANWNVVSGAVSYELDIASDAGFNSILEDYNALNVGNVLTYSVSDLECETTYYYRVRAVNNCGAGANSNIISQSTESCSIGISCFTIGGSADDYMTSVIPAGDGGYFGSGYTQSFGQGSYDIYMMKLDAAGAPLWTKTLGGSGLDIHEGQAAQSGDGGFYLGGTSSSFGAGNDDVCALKVDANGNLLWSRVIGGTQNDNGTCLAKATDGGIIVGGSTRSFTQGFTDMYFVKLSSTGSLVWTRSVGGSSWEGCRGIVATPDGGCIGVGSTSSYGAGGGDLYIVKLSSSGSVDWTRTVGGTSEDYADNIVATSDGGYAITGYSQSSGAGSYDVYVVKINGSGTLQWTRTVGGNSVDEGYDITETSDGGLLVVGKTSSFGQGNGDCFIVKLTSAGVVSWTKTAGGTEGDMLYSVILLDNGNLLASGQSSTNSQGSVDAYFVSFDANGSGCCLASSALNSSSGGNSGSGGVSGSGGTMNNAPFVAGTGGVHTVQCAQ